MSHFKVFVDGAVGTTGLRIIERLSSQPDIQLISLAEEQRKDIHARVEAIQAADAAILCLPDAAAIEIAALAGPQAKICDASTAHRTNPNWQYGFAELKGRREKLQNAHRVANPGCHATGFLALATPLVEENALPPSHPFVCHSLTGSSGGGKQMIAEYESPDKAESLFAPRLYGLGMNHKHLPEMKAIAGLTAPPLFTPVVDDYYSGMLVSLPLYTKCLAPGLQSAAAVQQLLANYYANEPLITVHPAGIAPQDNTLSANTMSGRDSLEIFVLGNEEQLQLAARFDNLGKGASGAAIQCMNLMLGRKETAGLVL